MNYKDLAQKFNKTQDEMYEFILEKGFDPEGFSPAQYDIVVTELEGTTVNKLAGSDIFEGGEIGSHSIDQSELEADEQTSSLINSGNSALDNADRVFYTEQKNFHDYQRASEQELRELKLTQAELAGAVEQQELIAARKRGAMQVLEIHNQMELNQAVAGLDRLTQIANSMSAADSEGIVQRAQARSTQNQALLANFTKRLGSSKRQ